MNKEEFVSYLKDLNIKINNHHLEQLDKYYNLLVTWNQKFNLTSILQEDQVYLKHFYDSLTITKIINLNNINTLLDVGSGAGFPSIVLKIFYPHLSLTIIDSNNKKIQFLQEVVKELKLDNVLLIHDRCENYGKNHLDTFDLVTARAVANLNTLIELCLPLTKVDGYFIALKGNIKEELKAIDNELLILNGKKEDLIEFILPKEESQRSLLKIKKTSLSPKGYPRPFDKIKKHPL